MAGLPCPSCPPQRGQPGPRPGTFSMASHDWDIDEKEKKNLRRERHMRNEIVDSEYEMESIFRHRKVPSPCPEGWQ